MTKRFPPAPAIGTPMLATRPSAEARQLLARRRSAGKHFIGEPGPSPEALDELLEIAARVPDHRKLSPWRFIVFEGDARAEFGKELARIRGETLENAESRDLIEAAGLFLRAPVVVAVISSPKDDGRTPVWEQELSAGAVCYNLLLAANASGTVSSQVRIPVILPAVSHVSIDAYAGRQDPDHFSCVPRPPSPPARGYRP